MKDVVHRRSIAIPRIYKDREQINVQNQCTLQIKMISLVKNTSISHYFFLYDMWKAWRTLSKSKEGICHTNNNA